jgi:hypothetical protein
MFVTRPLEFQRLLSQQERMVLHNAVKSPKSNPSIYHLVPVPSGSLQSYMP